MCMWSLQLISHCCDTHNWALNNSIWHKTAVDFRLLELLQRCLLLMPFVPTTMHSINIGRVPHHTEQAPNNKIQGV